MNNYSFGIKVAVAIGLGIAALGQVLKAEGIKFRGIVDFGGLTIGEVVSNSQILADMPDAEHLSYYRLTQKFNYKASETWTFGVHPVWHHTRKGSGMEWSDYYAMDFEANPSWKVSDRLSLSLRNRLAMIWKEGLDDDPLLRIRQRTKVSWKLPNTPLGFTAFSIANEVFWEDDRDMITQNRIFPVSLSFSPSKRTKSSISYGYFSKRIGRSSDWAGTHVIQLYTRF